MINLGVGQDRDVGQDRGDGQRPGVAGSSLPRSRSSGARGTLAAVAWSAVVAAVGAIVPAVIPSATAASGWLEPYPVVPEVAWTVVVTDVVDGPGTSTARFAPLPGSDASSTGGLLSFGDTWVAYIASDDAVPRIVGLDAATGEVRWIHPTPTREPPRVCADRSADGVLVCVESAGSAGASRLVLLSLADGGELARHPVTIDASSIALVGDDAVLGYYSHATGEFRVERMNLWTGKLSWAARVVDPVGLHGLTVEAESIDASGVFLQTLEVTSPVSTTAIVLAGAGAVLVSRTGSHVWLDLATGQELSGGVGSAMRRADGVVIVDVPSDGALGVDGSTIVMSGAWWAQSSSFVPRDGDHEIALPVWVDRTQRAVGWQGRSAPIVGIPTSGGPLAAFSSGDGSALWTAPESGVTAPGEGILSPVLVTPTAVFLVGGSSTSCILGMSGGNVAVCSASGPEVRAVDPTDGTTLWDRTVAGGQATVVGWDGTRVLVDASGGVLAIDGLTGETVWAWRAGVSPEVGTVASVDGRLVAVTGSSISASASERR